MPETKEAKATSKTAKTMKLKAEAARKKVVSNTKATRINGSEDQRIKI